MSLFSGDHTVTRNLGNVGGVAKYPETAHFPGGGPSDQTCAGCAHFIPTIRKRRGRCFLAANMRGLGFRFMEIFRAANPDWWRGLATIAGTTAACKYWKGPTP